MKLNAITFILAVFSVTLAPLPAVTVYQWSDNGSSNSWNDPSNWQNSNGNIPDGLDYGANFNGSATAGTRCFVTNQAGTAGLARTLASYGFYGTNSGDNWRIYAYQGEVASSDVSVTVHGTLASDLTGGASANLYHLLIIPSGASVNWESAGANINLNVGLAGSGTINGDNTAGGGMSVNGEGGFSGIINTGKNQIDIQNTLALENATINLQDTTANRLVYLDGTKIKAITGSGDLDLAAGKTLNVGNNNGTDFTFGGLLSGSGDLVKLGSAKWTLNGHTNTQTGKTIINGGSVKVGNLTALASSEVVINVNNGLDTSNFHLAGQTVPIGGLSGSGNFNFAHATLKIDGTSSASYTGTLSGTNGNLLMQSGSANFAGSVIIGGNVTVEGGTLTLSGTTSHGGSTTVNGGNLVVSGTPAFSGPITVNGGSLRINTSNQIPSLLGTLNLNNGGNVVINGVSHRIARLVVSSTNNEIFVNNGELILGENNDDIVIPCELSGIGANTVLRKQGAGTLFFASTNNGQSGNFNGTMHVESGVVSWGDGTLRGGFNPDNIVVSSTLRFDQGNNSGFLFCDSISGTGSVEFQSGLTRFNNTSGGIPTYTYSGGTSLNGGTAMISSVGELGTGSIAFNGGILGIENAAVTTSLQFTQGFTFGAQNVRVNIANAGHSFLWNNLMTHGGGFEKLGPGTVRFNQLHTFSGTTTITEGTLVLASGGSVSGSVINNGTLRFERGGNTTFSNTISGSGSVTQAGAAVLTLTGNNSYSGGTTVASGTLRVNNVLASSLGTGPVTVAGGAKLEAHGPLPSSLTVAGTLAPGNSLGTTTVNGTTTISGTYLCELDGAASDSLQVIGNLSIQSGAVLNFNVLTALTEPAYVIASWTGSGHGSNFTALNVPSGYSVVYNYANSGGNKNIALVSNAAPTVVSITPQTGNPTNANSIPFQVVFDKPVVGFNNTADVNVTTTGGVTHSLSNSDISGSGDTYIVNVRNVAGDGTMTLQVNTGTGISDGAGHDLAASAQSSALTIDNTGPTASIAAITGSPTTGDSAGFSVNFSQPVQTLTLADLAVSFADIAAGATFGAPQITGSGTAWTVTIPSVAGDGTLTLDIAASNTIQDNAGNPLTNNPAPASVTFNQTELTATITAVTASPSFGTSVEFTLVFSEAMQNLDPGDLIVTFPGSHDAPVITGSGATYSVIIANLDGIGALTLLIDPSNDIKDLLAIPMGTSPATDSILVQSNAVWTAAAGGVWSDGANWQFGLIPSSDVLARLGIAGLTGSIPVTLAADESVRELEFAGGGSFVVSGSTLTIASGVLGSAGSGSHVIASHLALGAAGQFDINAPVTLSGNLTGPAGLVKNGTAPLTIAGTSTLGGPIAVQTGPVTVNGTTGPVTVSSAGQLDGSGIIAGITASSGSTVAGTLTATTDSTLSGAISPGGGGIGTITIQGNGSMVGGTFHAQINGTQCDKLEVAGSLSRQSSQLDVQEIGAGATESVYVIADASSFSFQPTVTAIPSGYQFVTYSLFGGYPRMCIVTSAPPNCTAIVPRDPGPTNADTLVFDITFDKPIVAFNRSSDLIVTKDATLNYTFGSLVPADAFNMNFVLTLTNVTGNGSISITADPDDGGQSIHDGLGNNLASSVTSDPLIIDNVAPGAIIAAVTASPAPPGTIEFTLTFDENVENLTPDDLSVSFAGTHDTPVVTGSGSSFNIALTNVSGSGDLTLGIAPANDIADTAGNPLGISPTSTTVTVRSLFIFWALAEGLTQGVNDGFFDDPNADARKNIEHFALDTDPLGNGSDEGKILLSVLPDGGAENYLTYTIPVRKGAVFSGVPLTSAPIDGIIYTIHGSTSLTASDSSVVERNTATDMANLPVLSDYDAAPGADYEYRTFRLTTPAGITQAGFVWIEIGVAP